MVLVTEVVPVLLALRTGELASFDIGHGGLTMPQDPDAINEKRRG
jgi:hypothetical protein